MPIASTAPSRASPSRAASRETATALEEIYIPDSVCELSIGAFVGCTALKTVYLNVNFRNREVLDKAFGADTMAHFVWRR